jgi:hypothetical protein
MKEIESENIKKKIEIKKNIEIELLDKYSQIEINILFRK